jgi:hypothetical protein
MAAVPAGPSTRRCATLPASISLGLFYISALWQLILGGLQPGAIAAPRPRHRLRPREVGRTGSRRPSVWRSTVNALQSAAAALRKRANFRSENATPTPRASFRQPLHQPSLLTLNARRVPRRVPAADAHRLDNCKRSKRRPGLVARIGHFHAASCSRRTP